MTKRITKPKEKAVEPSLYTVQWSYAEKHRSGAVGGGGLFPARSKAEAQAIVEGKLRAKGITWKEITIVKGRDPGLTQAGAVDRYAAELQRMIGRLHVNAAAPDTPSPNGGHGDPTHEPDATARTIWDKFMDNSSHGLSVSDFPRFIFPGVDGYSTLRLPAEAVRDSKRWEALTSEVRDQLDYWKATLQERIERLGKVKRRSAEDADQRKRDKATLKELQAFDGWTYQAFVEAMLPGRKPHALDLDNRRLYRLSNGQLIPVSGLGTYVLRVDFWKRLLTLWDGPMDKRADNVRAFLDHHHRKGGKPEQFRDLVKDTLPRLRKLTGRELLVDKVEGWLVTAEQRLAEKVQAATKASKANDPNAWRDLKSLALFHAYRAEGGDTSADINPANAAQVARDAGFTKKSSGKELLAHFRRYAWGTPENKRIERTNEGKRPGDVMRRLHVVLPRLEAYPAGLAFAQAEHPIVRTRSNESED